MVPLKMLIQMNNAAKEVPLFKMTVLSEKTTINCLETILLVSSRSL